MSRWNNTVVLKAAVPMTVTTPVSIAIPLPAELAGQSDLWVKHTKNDGRVYYYQGTVQDGHVCFVNPKGFSTFAVGSEAPAASIDGVGYATLQQAADDVRNDQTILLHKDGESAVVSRSVRFKVASAAGQNHTAAITAAGGYAMEKDETTGTYTFTYVGVTDPSTPSGGGSGSSSYAVFVEHTAGGTVTVDPGRAGKGDTVTVTVAPDAGYAVDSITVNGDADGVKHLGGGKYTFTMPGRTVTVAVTFVKSSGAALPFADVPEDFWAYTEIAWAWENGYVNGTAATAFTPGGTITRQQVWMILARIAGEDPADMASARTWAIAGGVSDGTSPGAPVTRQQLVTIVYRFAGRNGSDTAARADLSAYPDAASVASYAADAMAWAVAEGILGGTAAGTLDPAGTASRAQFAAMLYRYMA